MAMTNPGTDNLESWWTLDETSGTRYDSHGSNNLTDGSTVGYSSSGISSNAADFERSNGNEILYTDSHSLNHGNDDIWFGCWVKMETNSNDMIIMGQYGDTSNGYVYAIRFLDPQNRLYFISSSDGTSAKLNSLKEGSDTALSTGTWYFVQCWYDHSATTRYIQVNDWTVGSDSTRSIYNNTDNDRWGLGCSGGLAQEFDGLIDEAFFFKGKIPTADERAWMYNSGSGRTYSDIALTHYDVTAGVGTFTFTGKDTSLLFNKYLSISPGSYTFIGTNPSLRETDIVLSGGAGLYTFTGKSLNLYKGQALYTTSGSFALTGVDASLRESDIILSGSAGSYTLTGKTASLGKGYLIPASKGLYSLTGTSVDLLTALRLASDKGTFSLSGTAASLRESAIILSGSSGSFALTGKAISLNRGYVLSPDPGTYTILGNTTRFRTYIAPSGNIYLLIDPVENIWLDITPRKNISFDILPTENIYLSINPTKNIMLDITPSVDVPIKADLGIV